MRKKGNLAAALTEFDRRPSNETQPAKAPTKDPEAKKSKTPEDEGSKTALPPSRRGKKALTGYFDPEVLRQLKILAASEDKTVQALMGEAINELFKKYGRPHIA